MMDFEGEIAEIKNKDNAETFHKSSHSLQAIVDNLLAHGTYGLAALKVLLDAIDSELSNGFYGLADLKILIDTVESKLDDGTTGLDALRVLLDAIDTKLDNLAGEASASSSVTGNWYSGIATSGETGDCPEKLGRHRLRARLLYHPACSG